MIGIPNYSATRDPGDALWCLHLSVNNTKAAELPLTELLTGELTKRSPIRWQSFDPE